MNRNGKISESKLYHTSQQLSQHDCSIRIFPTIISVCIWNKLYACFYLKDVMNMSIFFGILNEVWFINLHGGGATFVLHFLFFQCFKLQKFGRVEGFVAQTIVEDEGPTGSQRWFVLTIGSANPL